MSNNHKRKNQNYFQNLKFSRKSQIFKKVPLTISNSPEFSKNQNIGENKNYIFNFLILRL